MLAWLPSAVVAEPAGAAFAEKDAIVLSRRGEFKAGERLWFRLSKETRSLASGSAMTDGAGLRLPVALPDVKPGVVLRLDLTLRRGGEGGEALYNGALWAFSRRPFEGSYNPVAPRQIYLWDPAERTARAFSEIGISFEPVARLEALAELRDALLVVGEGVSLDEERALQELIAGALSHGNDLLMLTPGGGALRPPAWRKLAAGGLRDLFPATRKKQGETWPDPVDLFDPGIAGGARFQLRAERGDAVFAIAPENGAVALGWECAVSGSRFRVCGVPVIAAWDTSPAARWLLVEMLEHFKNKGALP